MKTFQIVDGFCYKDITDLAKKTDLSYITALHYEETPDYVFAGWGFDETKEGDERFIQPEPPEGWLYDPDTGTFYQPEHGKPDTTASKPVTWGELAAAYTEGVNSIG